jgi:hypothetical protein
MGFEIFIYILRWVTKLIGKICDLTSSPPYICYFMTSPLVYPVIIWLVSGYHFPLTGIQTPVDYIRYLVDYIRYPDAAGWFMFLLDSLNHWCKQPKSAENCASMTPKF